MTQKDLGKLIDYWLRGSDLDYASAVDISKKARRYVQACFFIHLSLEKALKAAVVCQANQQVS